MRSFVILPCAQRMATRAERRAVQEQQRRQKALQAMSERACELLLVRHGETEWNVTQRLQGQLVPGPPLTERGQRQAQVLAERLRQEPFDAFYSSDLLRALQTAEAVAAARADGNGSNRDSNNGHHSGSNNNSNSGSVGNSGGSAAAAIRTDARLRERDLGVLQGLSRTDAVRLHPEAYAALSAADRAPIEGAPESLAELLARAEAVLQDLAAHHPGQRLLVVTHGGFLQAAHERAAGCPFRGRNVNASINTIRIEAPAAAEVPAQDAAAAAAAGVRRQRQRWQWGVVRWGDADHLEGVGSLASAFGGSGG